MSDIRKNHLVAAALDDVDGALDKSSRRGEATSELVERGVIKAEYEILKIFNQAAGSLHKDDVAAILRLRECTKVNKQLERLILQGAITARIKADASGDDVDDFTFHPTKKENT